MSWFIMDTALGLALMCLYLIFAQRGRMLTRMRHKPHLAKKRADQEGSLFLETPYPWGKRTEEVWKGLTRYFLFVINPGRVSYALPFCFALNPD